MTRKEYNDLDSDGRVACPDCGLPYTKPYCGCHCPPSSTGYGKRHINEWHHDCNDAKRLETELIARRAVEKWKATQ